MQTSCVHGGRVGRGERCKEAKLERVWEFGWSFFVPSWERIQLTTHLGADVRKICKEMHG